MYLNQSLFKPYADYYCCNLNYYMEMVNAVCRVKFKDTLRFHILFFQSFSISCSPFLFMFICLFLYRVHIQCLIFFTFLVSHNYVCIVFPTHVLSLSLIHYFALYLAFFSSDACLSFQLLPYFCSLALSFLLALFLCVSFFFSLSISLSLSASVCLSLSL